MGRGWGVRGAPENFSAPSISLLPNFADTVCKIDMELYFPDREQLEAEFARFMNGQREANHVPDDEGQ